jgi:hypothetical protein
MSEWLLTWLLRLYPKEFRRQYGAEALQLMRDRARDERGVRLQLRLWVDLVADLVSVSLGNPWPIKPILMSANASAGRAPSLLLPESSSRRPQRLAAGIASIGMFAAFSGMLYPHAPGEVGARLLISSLIETSPAESDTSATQPTELDPAMRYGRIDTIAAKLTEHYFDAAVGKQLADALLDRAARGDYDVPPGPELAARVNTDIQDTSRILGIPAGTFVADVVYSARPIPNGLPPPPSAETLEQRRSTLLRQNCLVEKIETLPRNIGYLKLNGFPDVSECRSIISAAMASVNTADALILDLRDNAGGFGASVLAIAAYLFDRPKSFYDPRATKPYSAWTSSPVSGSKLSDKPVYVLTSPRTRSAAEFFAYNVKMLKRATIVGETTGGSQHSGAFHRIDDHFGMGIQQTAPPENPFPVKGWEVIGVEPDVKVSEVAAFDTARKLAESRVRRQ